MPRTQQQLKLDGIKVSEEREASIAGGFDVDEDDVASLKYDDMVVGIFVARVGVPQFKETKDGDLMRVDKLELGKTPQVRIVTNSETAEELADMFGLDHTGGRFQFEGDVVRHEQQELEEEPEPEKEPEPEPQPQPKAEPAKKATAKKAATKKAAGAKKGAGKKAAAKKAAAAPVAPGSSLVGSHVGGALANDEALRDFMGEPAPMAAGQ